MNAFVDMAYKAASNSTHPNHRMAAIIMRGGSVLSVAANMHRWGHCCERRAIRPHHDYAGSTLIVVRSNGGCSKPCKRCRKLIIEARIKRIVYIDRNGKLVSERV